MTFKISAAGITLIKSFEGCSLKAYRCPAGVWTIGWGTTEPINGQSIKEGMTITQQQADDTLISHLATYESAVNKYVTYQINQNQFDALVSFAYNCGCNALKNSDLLKYINKGDFNTAASQFDLWTRGGGKVLPGLVRRRTAEKALFLKACTIANTEATQSTILSEDEALKNAVNKIIDSGIQIDATQWGHTQTMKMAYVSALLNKLGGIEHLITKGVISDQTLWVNQKYTADHVRSLLIKYALKI